MTWLLDERPLRKILVSRLRYLGDIVMSTILLEILKAGDPSVELGYLCEQAYAPVLADEQIIDRLHVLGVARGGNDAAARRHDAAIGSPPATGTMGMVRQLRAQHYDLAVDLFSNPRSAWLLRLSGIRARIGGTDKSRRLLYTHTVIADDIRRQVPELDRWAGGALGDHLARLAPLRHAESGVDFMDWLVGYLGECSLCPRLSSEETPGEAPYVLLAPGATWPSKAWPLAAWRDLVPLIGQNLNLPLRVLVPPGRAGEFDSLARGYTSGQVAVLPPADLRAVKSLLAGAAAVVAVDGGVMHMSVALGRPTVALFGPTDPAIWFPYEKSGPYRVMATAPACHPCDLHECGAFVCLPELKPAAVVSCLAALMAGPTAMVPDEQA